MNESLIRAGRDVELPKTGLQDRKVHLYVNETFDFAHFGVKFPYALAMSVFSHISMNSIHRCLFRISEVLEPDGKFYATYYSAPSLHAIDPIEWGLARDQHTPPFSRSPVFYTKSDSDPFHYHPSVFEFLASGLPLRVKNIGVWKEGHEQQMLEFTHT